MTVWILTCPISNESNPEGTPMRDFLDKKYLYEEVLDHLINTLKQPEFLQLENHLGELLSTAVQLLAEDLLAYALRDPASKGRGDLILETYASFKAVLYYRLAHQIWKLSCDLGSVYESIAMKLSNKGKILSGAEIHPAAQIGRRFVLDHGFGTVIGETCHIGDDCYILCGVTLGAQGIANNPNGKRHPCLGNNVEIAAGAKILGPVVIGDNVFISPSCVITHDVPADMKVRIVNQVQLQKSSSVSKNCFLSAFALNERLHLVGEVMETSNFIVVDADHHRLASLVMECTARDRNHVQFRMRNVGAEFTAPRFPLSLQVSGLDLEVTLLDPPGLNALVSRLLQPPPLFIGG
jgi:serine O-acetyltransferase